MAKRPVLHLHKGRSWLLHRGGKGTVPAGPGERVFVPDQYGEAAWLSDETRQDGDELFRGVQYGIALHSYPLEIPDYLGHYFLPVEKAA
jgi:hypothetical protein